MIAFDPMRSAFKMAKIGLDAGCVPVGAVVVYQKKLIGSAHNAFKNEAITLPDVLLHAELIAMAEACKTLQTDRLDACDLYVTLEPCSMCASAITLMRIRRVIFGAYDPKGGGVIHGGRIFDHSFHVPEVIGGVMEEACGALLQQFFRQKR